LIQLTTKPAKRSEINEVIYDNKRWELLRAYRRKAANLLSVLENLHLQSIVHGSIARGDVKEKSDIDIFIPNPPSSFLIETALEQKNIRINTRMVIQATPTYTMKAYLEIDQATTISFPLMDLRKVEREFYKFSGEVTLKEIGSEIRIRGVDKRLMLIEPTSNGHIESSIINREEHVAKALGISMETVLDRVRTLLKRDSVGRTGVFIKKELAPDETFELALKRLSEANPAVRRRLNAA
jgi:predicted nucleotidyltransferase